MQIQIRKKQLKFKVQHFDECELFLKTIHWRNLSNQTYLNLMTRNRISHTWQSAHAYNNS